MKLPVLFCVVALLICTASAQRIRYVGHKEIPPINTPLGGVYDLYRTFQPAVKVNSGCVPFPAIGTFIASAGLRIGGAPNGLCSSSSGQVYVRHHTFHNGWTGIMYNYYFPKDQFLAGPGGHRHDWEEVIVWVDPQNRARCASLSAHGNYRAPFCNHFQDGTHKAVKYDLDYFTHAFLNTRGGGYYRHPLAAWDRMTDAQRWTLNNAEWRAEDGSQKASPSIRDASFAHKMGRAYNTMFR